MKWIVMKEAEGVIAEGTAKDQCMITWIFWWWGVLTVLYVLFFSSLKFIADNIWKLMAHPALISTNGYHHLLLGHVEVILTFGAQALPEILKMCFWMILELCIVLISMPTIEMIKLVTMPQIKILSIMNKCSNWSH